MFALSPISASMGLPRALAAVHAHCVRQQSLQAFLRLRSMPSGCTFTAQQVNQGSNKPAPRPCWFSTIASPAPAGVASEEPNGADRLISSLPLVRHLRSPSPTEKTIPQSSIYDESRPSRAMHPTARSVHMVMGSLSGPTKIPTDPYFFLESDKQNCRLIGICYIGSDLCGHPGFVHGGLLFTLFDDAFARCASQVFGSRIGMTANLDISFRNPSMPDRVYVYRSEVIKREGRKAWIAGEIRCLNAFTADEMLRRQESTSHELSIEESEGTLVAEAKALFIEPRDVMSMVPLYPQ
ncbi:HotDog domain-containing protein [Aspergillus bertholletiae]|uniref:HotDog domain-containing protein n=1 Tax=Aspergillus bertholletiae TaxID=1226010 RepID=A0A5N7BB91_9EURO|nr:HotDog domain-containing protein [Aspergillus bertholletiae]